MKEDAHFTYSCYAGNLGRTRQGGGTRYTSAIDGVLGSGLLTRTRSFEFLGACSADKTTPSPGPESFTTALIWALTKLEVEQKRFTVSELSRKIRGAPGFPKNQEPVQFDRAYHAIERIVLAPLDDIKDGPATSDTKPHGLLHLNFILAEAPSQKMIKKLAKALDLALKKEQLPIDRIAWGGLSSWEASQPSSASRLHVMRAVKLFQDGVTRRKSREGRQ